MNKYELIRSLESSIEKFNTCHLSENHAQWLPEKVVLHGVASRPEAFTPYGVQSMDPRHGDAKVVVFHNEESEDDIMYMSINDFEVLYKPAQDIEPPKLTFWQKFSFHC